ncbi:MAG: enolase C-terminal domain-like protein [Chitinophagaceae bacterium]
MISRRNFVRNAGVLPLLGFADLSLANTQQTVKPADKGPLIKSISIMNASGNFNRFISMNSYDSAPKGIKGVNALIKMVMNDGTEGIGAMGYAKPDDATLGKIKQLIGKDPLTFYTWKGDLITGVESSMLPYFHDAKYAWIESVILDVIGKFKNKPVWSLLGESARDGIDPYDGTIYFEDIARKTDVRIIGETAKRIKEEGYRAIKIKLGRPSKWLPGEAGVDRDIEAFIALREAVGNNFLLMADANNGYKDQYGWAVKLLKATIPYDMFFMEELFPDDAVMYKKLQAELLNAGLFIKIAEGENIRDLPVFDQYMRDIVYSYIQPDMPTCGMSNILFTARKAEKFPQVKLIPHVWQNQFGLIMSMHASKVQWNIPNVEDSRYFEHAFNSSGYLFKEGQWHIPAKPGWGVEFVPGYEQHIVDKIIDIG